jgi:two-component system, NarL family, sensor histidine kinase DegS
MSPVGSTPSSSLIAAGRHPTGASAHAAALIDAQERERRRIAFDLHDGPAQTLSAALLQARMMQDLRDDELRDGFVELRSLIAGALEEMYDLIGSLGAGCEANDDAAARVRSCVDAFVERASIACNFEVRGSRCSVPGPHGITVARIVQEALSNVLRHSRAARVHVTLDIRAERVVCEIVDDGRGFDLELASEMPLRPGPYRRLSYGLASMRERAGLLGGTCEVFSSLGQGTRVRVVIPVGERPW